MNQDKNMVEQVPFFLFSASHYDESAERNQVATEHVRSRLAANGIGYKEVVGVYQREREKRFLVHGDHSVFVMFVAFDLYNQESVLYVRADRTANLIYQSGKTEEVGVWQQVSPQEAFYHTSYTQDPATGLYYVCARFPQLQGAGSGKSFTASLAAQGHPWDDPSAAALEKKEAKPMTQWDLADAIADAIIGSRARD